MRATDVRRRAVGTGGIKQQSIWALLDQGCFAATSFAVTLVLARSIPSDALGTYALVYGVVVFAGTIHEALLTEPMLVLGARRDDDARRRYLGAMVGTHLVVMGVPVAGALLAVAIIAAFTGLSVTVSVVVLAIVVPTLGHWMLRRACYLEKRAPLAAVSSVLYFILLLPTLLILDSTGWISVPVALAAQGSISVMIALGLMVALRLRWKDVTTWAGIRSAAAESWQYGRWAVSASLVRWVPGNVSLYLLPLTATLGDAATYKVLFSVVTPALLVIVSVNLVLLPSMARAESQSARATLARRALLPIVVLNLVIWLILGLFGDVLIEVLFGAQYAASAELLWVLGLIPVVTVFSSVAGTMIRGRNEPDRLLILSIPPAVVAVSFGTVLVWHFGVAGAVWALVLTNVIHAALCGRAALRPRDVNRSTLSPVWQGGSHG